MEKRRNRYILLHDSVGQMLEGSLPTLGFVAKPTLTQLLNKGELLEALPENEQPSDPAKIALGGTDSKIRVECGMEDVMKLTVQEADLLLAISSRIIRYQICCDRKRLDFGKRLEYGSKVLVSINGFSKKLPGVIWYKGELPSSPGTMFGIELHENPGSGTSDGTFRSKQYFVRAPDCDVFVGLDKLAPFEDDNSELRTPPKSPKRDDHGQVNFKSRLDSVFPSLLKVKSDLRFPQPRHFDALKIDQRVVTFCDKGTPLRGTVRYTGDIEDSRGHVQSIVGLELDERYGSGTGKWKGHQLFICARNHALFVDIETIMLEEDFDKGAETEKKKGTSQKLDKQPRDLKMQERRHDKEIPTRSLSYNVQHESSVYHSRSHSSRRARAAEKRSCQCNTSTLLGLPSSAILCSEKSESWDLMMRKGGTQKMLNEYCTMLTQYFDCECEQI